MRRLALFTALLFLVAVGLTPQAALAQTDSRSLYDRLDRMERDMMLLQQQGRGGGSMVIRSPAVGGGVSATGPSLESSPSGTQASRLEDRINELEEITRQLTGKVEEANHRANQLAKQVERMQADIDLRFKELGEGGQHPAAQTGGGSIPGVATPALAATTPAGAPVLIPPKGAVTPGANSAATGGLAPGPMPLGQMSDKDARKAATASTAPKDPQSAYDEAFGLAQKGDYEGAEQGFQAFLKAYPTHVLAGNAQYWLGDIAYSKRNDFAQAARLFGEAYKKYPKHNKAPDMLYKLAASFKQLDMKDQACRAYSLLFAEHPDMPDRIKRSATTDRQKLTCK